MLKQENATEDTAAIIKDITNLFNAANMPQLADGNLYVGIPHSVLAQFHNALAKQRSESEESRFKNRMRYAGIVKERTEATFKWDDNTYPLAEPGIIEQILTIGFARQKKNLIMAGPPGVGKTLLAVVIACKALRAELSVKYKTAHDIATELREARTGNSLSGCIRRLQAYDMLVIEDLTFAMFDVRTAQAFFSVIDKRYGRKTTVITTNGNIKDWAGKFPDKSMCAALLGRIYEEAIVLNMNEAKDMRLSGSNGTLGDISENDAANLKGNSV